ncbi:oxidoreductase [Lentilactobacillus hilgardii]|uniref:oxidoreductase n=1 Tax=Lentilactobacillus hilgardii TaxID=1588 RepID=UPI003FA58F10
MNYLQVSKVITLPCGVTIKNRFVKTSLSETMATDDHQPNHLFNRLYRQWAIGGAGIVITGNVMVDRHALAEPGNIVVDSDRVLPKLRQWAADGTINDTQLWMQLNHPGRQSPKMFSSRPVAPSAIPITGKNRRAFESPRALTANEIKELVQKFVKSAVIAQKAGFTGVQLHGAFGYLINQFLSSKMNHRTDDYGGSIENRMRFLTDIYQGIRKACGPKFPISLKLSLTDIDVTGFTQRQFEMVIKKMAALGIDMIEIAGDDYENSQIGFSGQAHFINQLVNVPIALSGGFRHISAMEEALGRQDASLIGVCTPMAFMTDMPNQILRSRYQPFVLPLSTGSNRLDDKLKSIIVTSYCEEQIRRIAEGKQPKLYRNAWLSMLAGIQLHGIKGLKPRRAQ